MRIATFVKKHITKLQPTINIFRVVGMTSITFSTIGENIVYLNETEQFEVQQGDTLGLQWKDQQAIAVASTSCSDNRTKMLRLRYKINLKEGQQLHFREPDKCMVFKLQAIILPDLKSV